MTVTTTDVADVFTASSGTTEYSVSWKVRSADDIVVELDGVIQTGGGDDYSVTLLGSPAGETGATITPTAPWSSGTLRIYRQTTTLQSTDLETAQRYDPDVIEQALDLAAMRDQEDRATLERTIRGPAGETLDVLPSATERASKTLVFDSSGNPGVGVALTADLSVNGVAGPTKIIHSVDADTAKYGVGLPDGDYGDFTFASGVATIDDNVIDTDAIVNTIKADLNIDDIWTTIGVSDGDTDLGTFTGSTISDSGTVKEALQELETALEASGPSAYVSSDQTITAGGTLTLAHGLGAAPDLWAVFLECQTADLNYSTGEVILAAGFFYDGNAGSNLNYGCSVRGDATNLVVRFGSTTGVFSIPDASTGAISAITSANWKAIFKAWVF